MRRRASAQQLSLDLSDGPLPVGMWPRGMSEAHRNSDEAQAHHEALVLVYVNRPQDRVAKNSGGAPVISGAKGEMQVIGSATSAADTCAKPSPSPACVGMAGEGAADGEPTARRQRYRRGSNGPKIEHASQPCGSSLVSHDESGQRLCSRGCRRPARPPLPGKEKWRWCEQCTAARSAAMVEGERKMDGTTCVG